MIDFILRPIRRNFGKDKRFFAAIDDMFGFIPNNIELYKLALIHKSASIVLEDGQHINNERLEFLGDAVLESVSSDYLFIEYPDKNEGFLTKLRSKIVSRQMLNEVAKRIGLDDYVITHSSNNISQKHIYGDAFEAMMGAIYLDQGYDFVNRLLINKIFVDYIKVDQLTRAETDFKSRLIEWCQKNHHTIYFDTENDKTYSSTHPFFYSKVLIDNIEMGYGAGESKKEAEQRAAYSVSQGFSDEDCTKLLDKLDTLDAKSRVRSMRQYRQSSEVEVVANDEAKSNIESEPTSTTTSAEAATAVEEVKPAVKRRRSRKPSAKKSEVEVAAEVAEPIQAETIQAEPQPKSEPQPKAKPASKSKPASQAEPQSESELQLESDVEKVELVVADTAESTSENAPKKSRRRTSSRGRSAKSVKAATADDASVLEASPAESKPSDADVSAEGAVKAKTSARGGRRTIKKTQPKSSPAQAKVEGEKPNNQSVRQE